MATWGYLQKLTCPRRPHIKNSKLYSRIKHFYSLVLENISSQLIPPFITTTYLNLNKQLNAFYNKNKSNPPTTVAEFGCFQKLD